MKLSEKAKMTASIELPESVDSPPVESVDSPPVEVIPVSNEIPITLDEFCQRLSETERRVALLGAFHFEMKRQKRQTGLSSDYHAAYATFINAPA